MKHGVVPSLAAAPPKQWMQQQMTYNAVVHRQSNKFFGLQSAYRSFIGLQLGF